MRPFIGFPFVIVAALGLILSLFILFIFVQVGLVTIAFSKLGLTTGQGFMLLIATLLGSSVNIPIHKTKKLVHRPVVRGNLFGGPLHPLHVQTQKELVDQIIAINFGGCVIPVCLSLYFAAMIGFSLPMALAVGVTALICYQLARPLPGRGIGIPVLLPPLAAALASLLLAPEGQGPHIAYIAGSIGTLIGADILHLATPKTKNALDAPVLSIGGAGTFDGIFLSGIIAVLLA